MEYRLVSIGGRVLAALLWAARHGRAADIGASVTTTSERRTRRPGLCGAPRIAVALEGWVSERYGAIPRSRRSLVRDSTGQVYLLPVPRGAAAVAANG